MQLRTWREREGLTLQQLADWVSFVVKGGTPCTRGAVQRWEKGITVPSLAYAMAILEVTDGAVTLADLVRASEGKAP